MSLKPSFLSLVLLVLVLAPLDALAQDETGYQMPPQILADIIDAPQTPWVSISPDNQWMMFLERPGLPSIEEVAQPELRLAGLRINPRTNGPSRQGNAVGLVFHNIDDGKEKQVTGIPEGARITGISWSHDSQRVAFNVTMGDRISLWYAELKNAKAKEITPKGLRLNGVYGRPYQWIDEKNFVVRAVPEGRGDAPSEPLVPTGPVIQENLGKKAPARTLQDLLQNSYDESLYDYYTTSQLVTLNLKGKAKPIGPVGVLRSLSVAPGGEYLLTETVKRPYSYTLQEDDFPKAIEVWNLKGDLVYQVADLPLQDQVPISFGSVATGPRSVEWRDDQAAELVWVEALDGGDGGIETDTRDEIFTLAAPFNDQPESLMVLSQRYGGVMWGNDDLAFVVSWWWKTRNLKVHHIKPGDRNAEPVVIQDRSFQDRYADPGQPLMHPGPFHNPVIMTVNNGRTIYLQGQGASPEGNRPFLDTFDLETQKTTRLFRSEAPYFENPVELLDVEKGWLLTRRESQTDPPNYFVRELNGDGLRQITHFADPAPQLKGISKELITYKRDDGVDLTATLYLPAGYDKDKDGPLPTLLWAYPTEFKSKKDAGQVTDSPYRFTRVFWASPMLYLTLGYAVLDDPTMPIIGEGETEPNDTFVQQLVASAQAAVDEVVGRGVTDPDRIAVGGHSYGAFMTANLLAHSDLFRLGLPRSGAYNRTLTPFGFQSEERSLWEAPEVYFNMSPFMHADKIDEPILLVHGAADNNSGTFPMQSERMYGALKGHGATTRLVMLPHESHSYRARESIMHLLWETANWLDRYVKNANPRGMEAPEVPQP